MNMDGQSFKGVGVGGEKNLGALLAGMTPELGDEEYVFCTTARPCEEMLVLKPWAMAKEKEGLSLILDKAIADRSGIPYEGIYRRISLNIHSSLDAVGLTAAISAKLAAAGISANVVAAYYHDHVFIQVGRAEEALELLMELSKK